ncbi:MAG: hypothetical protein ASARMPREDX12_002380 [Alectoria sarmentosa]|nr:MAG: hypothetical protein ASARMPREDX12_002380 [Alectoria sarmentosa]
MSQTSVNSTSLNSTISEILTGPYNSVPFPIENSTITLRIFAMRSATLDKTALRNVIYDAYTFVSNLIDIVGDGHLPTSADPFEAGSEGAYLVMTGNRAGPRLKWSSVRDVLWGLREYMVVQDHSFELGFTIAQEGVGGSLGAGYVLRGS